MYSGSRTARRHRTHRSGSVRVAAQLAVPVVLGLLIGGVLAYQAGSSNNLVQPVPLGAVPTPTPSFGHPGATRTTPATPATPATTPATNTTATTATTTDGNANCGVIAPANPLTAPRLAALYQFTGAMTPAESGCGV